MPKQHPFDLWSDQYEPIKDGYMFDTDGDDYDLIKVIDNDHIWTLIDESGAGTFLVAGFYLTNRIGYYVTKKPWTNEHETITLREAK